jgi:hypothetical protein
MAMLKRKPLWAEMLEDKAMLAGDVIAAIDTDGNLTISGDNRANAVEISATAEGNLVITGIDDTTVTFNGQTTAAGEAVDLGSVTGDVTIDLHGGDDSVSISGGAEVEGEAAESLRLGGKLTIIGGNGQDKIVFDNVDVADELHIDTGAGNDAIDLNAVAAASVKVDTGRGDDGIVATGLTADGAVKINTAQGDDDVDLNGIVSNRLTVDVGNGADSLNIAASEALIAKISTGAGDDDVSLDGLTAANLSIDLGKGDDILEANGTVSAVATVTGDAGDDVVNFSGLRGSVSGETTVAARLAIDAGVGNDVVEVAEATLDQFFVNLGRGLDNLIADGLDPEILDPDLDEFPVLDRLPNLDDVADRVPIDRIRDRLEGLGDRLQDRLGRVTDRLDRIFGRLGSVA